jgi:hypothetical protein
MYIRYLSNLEIPFPCPDDLYADAKDSAVPINRVASDWHALA